LAAASVLDDFGLAGEEGAGFRRGGSAVVVGLDVGVDSVGDGVAELGVFLPDVDGVGTAD
jgi:hypothetical protein